MNRVKTVLSCILAVFLFVTSAAAAAMAAGYAEYEKISGMSERIADDEYVSLMSAAVSERVKTTLALSVVKPDDIMDLFDADMIRRESEAALEATLSSAVGKEEEYSFSSDMLRTRVEETLKRYSSEQCIDFDEAAVEQTYAAISDAVSSELSVISSSYIKHISPLALKLRHLLSMWYIPAAVSAVLLTGVILLCLRDKFRMALTAVTPLYFAAFIPGVLFAVLEKRDYFSNTVLSGGVLSHMMRRAYLAVCGDMKTVMLIAAAILAAVIVSVIVIMAVKTASAACEESGESGAEADE